MSSWDKDLFSEKKPDIKSVHLARIRNLLVPLAVMLFCLFAVFRINPSGWAFAPTLVPYFLFGSLVSCLAYLALGGMLYLQTGRSFFAGAKGVSEISRVEKELAKVRRDFDALEAHVSHLGSMILKPLEDSVLDAVKASVACEVWHEVSTRSEKVGAKEKIISDIKDVFDDARDRLLDEVKSLGWRSNLNLILGAGTTVIGLTVLGYFLWQPLLVTDGISLAVSYAPRLSLVAFIQLFAFFFLRLYRSAQNEIKYFQNEITNLELKYAATCVSFLEEESDVARDVVKSLVGSERNSVLQQGQTTVELEKFRVEQNAGAEVLKILPKIIGRRN